VEEKLLSLDLTGWSDKLGYHVLEYAGIEVEFAAQKPKPSSTEMGLMLEGLVIVKRTEPNNSTKMCCIF
jgi:hypothetical protein